MPRLLKIFILVLSFSFLVFSFSTPAFAQTNSCSFAPQPNSQTIIDLIKKVQSCGGAAKYVPLKVLQAIYWIEGTTAYANPSAYICKKNSFTALGLMQIVDNQYHSLTPSNEQLSDDQQQCSATGKFSRCFPNDSIEIAARVLLDKIFIFNKSQFKPTGSIVSKNDVYYASGRYYGSFQPDNLTNQLASYLSSKFLYPIGHSLSGTLTYPEFICALSGFCNSYQDYPSRADKPYSGTTTNPEYNFSSECLHSTSTGSVPPTSAVLPLRPNPFELVKEEKDRPISDPNLAPFCAFRPTVVQNVIIDKRNKKIALAGLLTTDFSSFVTPFLSAPVNSVSNQRYLADYLEADVFQKLAPASYQDQLKNAMIARATGNANTDIINQAYGFPTATTQIHDYEINTPYGKFKLSQLQPKPLDDPDALVLWQTSLTASAWPYVPMFTREDSKGFIQSLPEPGQLSVPKTTEVIHPHLARTYEVSSSIANLLSPESTHQFQKPDLPVNWVEPAPWTADSYWLDSSQSVPPIFGPVCEPQLPTRIIAGPGDLANNQKISTVVFKQFDNPLYDPSCIFNGNIFSCFATQEYRFSPIYLKTYTPFLDKIAFNLLTGPGALFGIFKTSNEQPENWPAIGNDNQTGPNYSFAPGQAEAGLKKTAQPAQYLYSYLGTLHCQKEKLIATLQPFLTGQSYALPPECEGTIPAAATAEPSSTNPLGQWLQWPSVNHSPPDNYTSCYGRRCWQKSDGSLHFAFHGGLDVSYGDGAEIYAAAPGIIQSAGYDNIYFQFGYYVIINHQNGWYTIYAHMKPNLQVSTGESVTPNSLLGYQDNTGESTGTHLHLGLSQGGNISDFFMSSGLTVDVCSAIAGCTCNPNQYNNLNFCPADNAL